MAKKKTEETPEQEVQTIINPFIGGEEDDLMDMEYVQDESTVTVDTHPPATEEEAEARAEIAAAEVAEEKDEALGDEVEQELTDEKDEQQEAEAEAPAAVEEKDTEQKVPYDRFSEVNNERKTLKEENERLKQQLETVIEDKTTEAEPEPYDYKTKEKEAMDALLEGDADKYSAINEEIRQAEKAEYVREAQKLADAGDQHLKEDMTFEETGAKIEADFPELSATAENFNEAAREEMLDLFVGYAQSGRYTRVQALQHAADKVARLYSLGVEEAEPTPDNVVDIKAVDPKKKAKVANSQPPSMEGTTESTREAAKRDVASMSDEEFDSLPESTKRKWRGDIL